MAEPTLALKYADLKASAGLFLGYGRGNTDGYTDKAWNARQSAVLDMVVKGGLRLFYFPPPIDAGGVSYEWSFLRPTTELTLSSGADSIDLPDDFGGVVGTIQLETASQELGLPLQVTSMSQVRQLRTEFPDSSGRPLWAAVEPQRGTTKERGQRWTLEIYPAADQAYTLQVSYNLTPNALDGSRPYAYGGPTHSETIEAAIAAVAEVKLDDVHNGPRWQYFMSRLATSISQDRKLKPQMLGYNGDRSNAVHAGVPVKNRFRGNVTVYGVQY